MDLLIKAVIFFSLLISAHAATAACTLDVEVGDGLMFNAKELSVEKSCGNITVNLKHTGKMAANIMGHNWVLTSEADANDVAGKGSAAGLANNYVPKGDARVIAATKVIGGGETDSISFSTDSLTTGEKYLYVCTFPGHSFVMRGTLLVGA